MAGALYFQNWVQTGYIDQVQVAIRKYLICILAAILVVVIDIAFLIWRFHRGDLAN